MKKKKNVALVVMVTALVFIVVAGGCDIYNPVIDEWWVGPDVPGGGVRTNTMPIKFYTIMFNSNGGNYIDLVHPDLDALIDPPLQRIQAGQNVAEPGLVENSTDEYITGWYIDVDGDGVEDPEDTAKWDFNRMSPTSNMTLIAKWANTGDDITFNLNATGTEGTSGTVIQGTDTTYYSSTNPGGLPRDEHITPGNILSIPKWFGLTGPKANDYVFYGWYKDDDTIPNNPVIIKTENLWDFSKPPTGDMTLYAGWGERTGRMVTPPGGGAPSPVPLYTVTFVTNSNSPIADQTIYSGGKIPAPNAITRDSYVFGGWYTDSSFTTAYTFDTPVTSNITLYAKWTVQPYSDIWFDDPRNCVQTTPPGGYNTKKYFPFQLDAEGTGEGAYDFLEVDGVTDTNNNFSTMETVQNFLKSDPRYIARIVGYSTDPLVSAQRELDAWWNICGDETGVNREQVIINTKLPVPYDPAGDDPPIYKDMIFGNNAANPAFTTPTDDEVKVYLYLRL